MLTPVLVLATACTGDEKAGPADDVAEGLTVQMLGTADSEDDDAVHECVRTAIIERVGEKAVGKLGDPVPLIGDLDPLMQNRLLQAALDCVSPHTLSQK